MKKYSALVLCCAALGCNESTKPSRTDVTTQKPVVEAHKPVLEANNTGVNVRDRDQATKTPIDQNENKKDVEITASIRKKVVNTKMSTAAHNVKIITQDGKVTLRGPVESAEEKQQIAEIAGAIVGPASVDDLLEVEAPK